MTLKELAKQYRDSADTLRAREEEIKRQLKAHELMWNLAAEARLKALREERYDLIHTAYYLENYYSHRDGAAIG